MMQQDKLIRISTGLIVGVSYGYIVGVTFFEPGSGLWIPISLISMVTGGIVGGSTFYVGLLAPTAGSALGLYLGWMLASYLIGDHLGGVGAVIVVGGLFVGWKIGASDIFMKSSVALSVLVSALHGYFLVQGIILVIGNIFIADDLDVLQAFAPLTAITVVLFGLIGYILAKTFQHNTDK